MKKNRVPVSPEEKKRLEEKFGISAEAARAGFDEYKAEERERARKLSGDCKPSSIPHKDEDPEEPLRPRTVAEEHLYIECRPCACGERRFGGAHELKLAGAEMLSIHAGACPSCGRERRFELIAPPTPEVRDAVTLGGPTPSAILDPGQFLLASDRLAGQVKSDSATNEDGSLLMRRAAACVAEVIKFIPDGADEVPASAFHSAEGAELRSARASQFRRDRLEARRWEYRVSAARLKPKRVKSASPMEFRGVPDQFLNREVAEAHKQWLARSRTGLGRIFVQSARLDGLSAGAGELTAARFVGCKMSKIDLSFATMNEIELIDCLLDEAKLNRSYARDALVRGCVFMNADLRLAHLERSRLQVVEMGLAALDRCRFDETEVEDSGFEGAYIYDATFDRAIVVDCDFRNADLTLRQPALKLCSMKDAAFIRCDFRGARWQGRRISGTLFEDCKFDGATGKADIQVAPRVVRADVNPFVAR